VSRDRDSDRIAHDQECKELKEEVRALEREVKTLENAQRQLKGNVTDLQNRQTLLQRENKNLKSEIDTLKVSLVDMKIQRDEWKTKHEIKEKQIDCMNDTFARNLLAQEAEDEAKRREAALIKQASIDRDLDLMLQKWTRFKTSVDNLEDDRKSAAGDMSKLGHMQEQFSQLKDIDKVRTTDKLNRITRLLSKNIQDLQNYSFCHICQNAGLSDGSKDKLLRDKLPLQCGHKYCLNCIGEHLLHQHKSKKYPLQCPACPKADPIEMELVVEIIKEMEGHNYLSANKIAQEAMSKTVYQASGGQSCPTADCTYFVVIEGNYKRVPCPMCKRDFCAKCRVTWHDGITCATFQENEEAQLLSGGRYRCPNQSCRALCEPEPYGCRHMVCTVCQCHYCSLCKEVCRDTQATYEHCNRMHQGIFDPNDIQANPQA